MSTFDSERHQEPEEEHGDSRWEVLAMKAVDGQLTDAERAELDALLAADPARRRLLDDLLGIKDTTDALASRIRASATAEPLTPGPGGRSLITIGLVSMLIGYLVVAGFALSAYIADPAVPMPAKIGSCVAALGGLSIFTYVLVGRLRGYKHDPYTEIDR